jgi:hypothetical protein
VTFPPVPVGAEVHPAKRSAITSIIAPRIIAGYFIVSPDPLASPDYILSLLRVRSKE